ncbi:hypothetical protein RBB50_003073 [Rhinocladiella similis]
MPEGGCLCGSVRIAFTGEPAVQALCYCGDCRKISGSAFSTNVLVPDSNFQLILGSPKTYQKVADSGKKIKSYFCGDCGSTCYREGESFPGLKIVKAGTLDVFDVSPHLEAYVDSRVTWLKPLQGAEQPSSSDEK